MKWSSLALLLAALAAATLYLRGSAGQTKEVVQAAISYIEAQGDNAMAAYLVFTVFGVIALVPTTLMEFSGGFLFVPRYGLITTWLLTCAAKLVANIIAVSMARHLIRDWVRRNFVEKSELLSTVSKAVRQEPFKMAFLVRGSMVPLSVKNYGLGVLDIGYVPIACASCVFSPFYAYQNIYMGSACQDLTEIFTGKAMKASDGGVIDQVKKILPLVCNIVLVLVFVRVIKAQLAKSRAAIQADLKARQAQDAKDAPAHVNGTSGTVSKKEE